MSMSGLPPLSGEPSISSLSPRQRKVNAQERNASESPKSQTKAQIVSKIMTHFSQSPPSSFKSFSGPERGQEKDRLDMKILLNTARAALSQHSKTLEGALIGTVLDEGFDTLA